jgi:hypothetical protein
LQKAIYELIVSSWGVKKVKIAQKFEISLLETENQFALLRLYELVKRQKGQMVYILYLSKINISHNKFNFDILNL